MAQRWRKRWRRLDYIFKTQGVECLLAGDVDTGKIVLRGHINATVGFEELGSLTTSPPKNLMRMFGPSGNTPKLAIYLRSSAVFSGTRVSNSKWSPFDNRWISD